MAKIENELHYKVAMERIEELLPLVKEETPLTNKNLIELELLSNLVADYDEEHFPIKQPDLIDVLKLRMYELNLSQAQLAKVLQVSPSRVSELLKRKCEPTLKTARIMSKELKIDANIVLGV